MAMLGAMVEVVIRDMRAEDEDALLDLLEQVAAERRWIAREPPVDRTQSRARLRAGTAQDGFVGLVAEIGTQVVGHIWLAPTPYGVAELGMMLAPSWRGRGIGTKLVATGVERARRLGAHKIALEVWPHNAAAMALYDKAGFVEEGRLRRHYRRANGELWDAVVMGLVLDEDQAMDQPGSPSARR
ncbi:hypothetical protein BH20ACT2_BH20ACT2_23700 [soil metagenome]